MPTQNQIASAICAALGMPSRFAAEKPVVSPTLRDSLATYYRGLSDKALEMVSRKAPKFSREVAAAEIARRAALPAYGEDVLVYTPDSRWVKAHLEPALDGWPAYWQGSGGLHWPVDSVLRWKPLPPVLPAPACNGQCGICSCISSPQAATATPSK